MTRFAVKWFKNALCPRLILTLLAVAVVLAGHASAGQGDERPTNEQGPPHVGEGSLLYRSPISGRFEAIPLLHTGVAIDVRGLVASATVTQEYANSNPTPVEAVYVFPLPHDAAVYDMEIQIGNRVIRSEIRERAEAKRVYEAAKSEGKRAALLEQERPNIFTTSVANIMPGDKIEIRMRYVEPLQWEAGRIRLVLPMVVGPRYIPGTQALSHDGTGSAPDTNAVPDASRITPIVRNPESRSGHDISVSVDLDPGFEAASVTSVSHSIHVQRLSDGRQHVELASSATLPNKDFILEVQQAESTRPKAALFLSPASDSGETHFLLAAFPPTVKHAERMPVEMLYMIDVSGSMEGTSIEQARAALLQALDRLRPNDRFGILQFSSGYSEFSPDPLPATPANVAAARRYVEHLEANGGTEMLPALLHLMRKPETAGYLRHIVLLTDGDLGNEEEIFAALRSDLAGARLYTVAIGSAPNLFLATKMAQYGRGTFTHIADISEIKEQMTRLFEGIESPVLTDVKLTFTGVEVSDVYPNRVPDLFLGQPLLIFGRITQGRAGTMHLTGRAGNDTYETTVAFDASQATFHPGITTLWARQRVEELMDHWRHSDEKGQTEIRGSLIAHAIRYRLVTRFTSLVAVEEIVSNTSGQSNTVPVPTELPAGWKMDKVFGAPATGTTDAFFEALGTTLLLGGICLLLFTRKFRAGALS
jgi:Ca-activated chloride channel family protein